MSKKLGIILAIAAAVISLSIFLYRDQFKIHTESSQDSQPSEAYKRYEAIRGEAYDRTFIANMIVHHQGAIDMAKLAQNNARHQEIKSMADNIVSAQEKEIVDMRVWQKEWGYPSTDADTMMDHSAMGMMDDMTAMTARLEGKVGDEFDKAFIKQMLEHHQGAIDMAMPGEKNAEHQEVRNLTKAIVSAQSKEVKQMKQWQKDWGYEN